MPAPDPNTILLLESIRDGLKRLEGSVVFSMQSNADLMRNQFEQSKKIEKSVDQMTRESHKSSGLFGRSGLGAGFAGGLTSLGLSIMSLGSIFKQTMGEANELQKQALARGQTLGSVIKNQTQVTEALGQGILGFSDSLGIGFDAFSKGLRSNNVELAKAGAMSKLTTGQNKQFMKAVAHNTEGLGFNDEAITRMALSSRALAEQFGVSIEELQDSIKTLGKSLAVMGALGQAPGFTEAAQRLSASLGPELKDMGPKLLDAMTKGSSMIQAQILGVGAERQAFLNKQGNMTSEAFALMMKASERAEDLTKQWTRGAADSTFMISKMESVYGSNVTELVRMRQGWKEAADEMGVSIEKYLASVQASNKVSEEFKNTFAGFKSRVLSPFQKLFTWFSKILFKIMDIPGIDMIASAIIGVTGVLVGLASIQTLLGSKIGANTIALAASTKASLTQAAGGTSSALASLLYYLPFGPKRKAKLPGSFRNTKTGRFTQGPTGFWSKLKSVFGVGPLAKSKPGALARGGIAATKAGGGSAFKGILKMLGTLATKLAIPLTILMAVFSELKALKKIFSDFGAKIWSMTEGLRKQFSELGGPLMESMDGIEKLFSPIGKILVFAVDILLDVLTAVAWIGIKLTQIAVWLVKQLLKGINIIFKYVINPLVGLLNDIVEWLNKVWNKMFGWTDNLFGSDKVQAPNKAASDIDKYAVALEPHYEFESPEPSRTPEEYDKHAALDPGRFMPDPIKLEAYSKDHPGLPDLDPKKEAEWFAAQTAPSNMGGDDFHSDSMKAKIAESDRVLAQINADYAELMSRPAKAEMGDRDLYQKQVDTLVEINNGQKNALAAADTQNDLLTEIKERDEANPAGPTYTRWTSRRGSIGPRTPRS